MLRWPRRVIHYDYDNIRITTMEVRSSRAHRKWKFAMEAGCNAAAARIICRSDMCHEWDEVALRSGV